MNHFAFEKLDVYQASIEIVVLINKITESFSRGRAFFTRLGHPRGARISSLFVQSPVMKKEALSLLIFLLLSLFCTSSHSGGGYYLCGSDEDGCHDYRFCACIPQIETKPSERFCLDFDSLICQPLSQKPDCYSQFIFENQGECIATIFQSEPRPPCPLVSHDFCLENHVAFCDSSGQPNSCH